MTCKLERSPSFYCRETFRRSSGKIFGE